MQILKTVLISLCPLALLACSTTQPQKITVIKTVTEKVYPPKQYTEQTPVPTLSNSNANGLPLFSDVVALTSKTKTALLKCNADKQALSDWGKDGQPEQ